MERKGRAAPDGLAGERRRCLFDDPPLHAVVFEPETTSVHDHLAFHALLACFLASLGGCGGNTRVVGGGVGAGCRCVQSWAFPFVLLGLLFGSPRRIKSERPKSGKGGPGGRMRSAARSASTERVRTRRSEPLQLAGRELCVEERRPEGQIQRAGTKGICGARRCYSRANGDTRRPAGSAIQRRNAPLIVLRQ